MILRRLCENAHEFIAADRFLLIQILGNLIQLRLVRAKYLQRFSMHLIDKVHNLSVDLRLRLRGACQRRVTAQILVLHSLKSDHTEVVAHTVLGNHLSCEPCRLFDIIRSSGRNTAELDFFRRAATGQRRDLVQQLFSGYKIMISLIYLHRITERT